MPCLCIIIHLFSWSEQANVRVECLWCAKLAKCYVGMVGKFFVIPI